MQRGSWGYLLERGVALGAQVVARLSRVPEGTRGSHHLEEEDEYGADHTSQIHLAGRVVLNVWRLMRAEVRTGLMLVLCKWMASLSFACMYLLLPLIPTTPLFHGTRAKNGFL